jgi:DNA polymerase
MIVARDRYAAQAIRAVLPPDETRSASLAASRREAAACTACHLWQWATQTVFGEGPPSAALMLVGEQPGDQEDRVGRPFVGPAGKLLDRALHEAGIDRAQAYVTNAVKHFKFVLRGKRRLHKKPIELEIAACRDWLERELALVQPRLVIALGATAVRALLGRAAPVTVNRRKILPFSARSALLITVHPSYLLRVPDENKETEFRRFVEDLRVAADYLEKLP